MRGDLFGPRTVYSIMIESCITPVVSSTPLSRWQLFEQACNQLRPFENKGNNPASSETLIYRVQDVTLWEACCQKQIHLWEPTQVKLSSDRVFLRNLCACVCVFPTSEALAGDRVAIIHALIPPNTKSPIQRPRRPCSTPTQSKDTQGHPAHSLDSL